MFLKVRNFFNFESMHTTERAVGNPIESFEQARLRFTVIYFVAPD